MTCRNRRRKCKCLALMLNVIHCNIGTGDEGKPVCQNCMSKGFDCQYAAAFQILGKHNFTPEVKNIVKYANVRVSAGRLDVVFCGMH